MEQKIFVVNVVTIYTKGNSTEIDFKTTTTYKAFAIKNKAIEYTKMLIKYFDMNKINGIIHDIYIKEVDFE